MKISSFLSYHLQNKKRSHEQNPFRPCLRFLSFMIQHLLYLPRSLLLPTHRELKEPRARILFPTLQLREAAPRPREMTCKIRKIGRLLRSPFQKDILSL